MIKFTISTDSIRSGPRIPGLFFFPSRRSFFVLFLFVFFDLILDKILL